MRLEEAQLAHPLGADPAGGEVGDASGIKFHAHVGDIHLGRENGQADGANLLHWRIHEGEHDVEVVDHEVEHHVHVERARGEDAQPMHFEKHGLSDERHGGAHRRIEPLQLADLRDALLLLSNADEFVGFFQ